MTVLDVEARDEQLLQVLADEPSGENSQTRQNAKLQVRVEQIIWHTDEIIGLILRHPEGSPLPSWEAGAHIDLQIDSAPVRSYSLCGVPGDNPDSYEIAVKREPNSRGGSAAVHDRLKIGQLVHVGTPRNLFSLDDKAPHHLLMAGGIGLTPLVAMAHALHLRGASFRLAVFARSKQALALRRTLEQAAWCDHLELYLDDAPDGKPTPEQLLKQSPVGSHVYFCGPQGFMNHVLNACAEWESSRVHYEYFAPPASKSEQATSVPTKSIEIRLARQDRIVMAEPGQNLAHALQQAGVFVDTVCEQGICGSCVTTYLDGHVEHQDVCLNDDERRTQLALCCAHCTSEVLTLDC